MILLFDGSEQVMQTRQNQVWRAIHYTLQKMANPVWTMVGKMEKVLDLKNTPE